MNGRQVKWGALGLLSVVAVAASCSKKKAPEELSEGAEITISGQLAISNSAQSLGLVNTAFNATDVNPDDLQVYCVSFEIPPKAGTGDVDGEGKFSLTIAANDVSIGCFVQKGEATLATMVFEDTDSKDVSGSSKKDGRMAFSGNASLGTIKLDVATGKAVADVTNLKSQLKRFEGSDGFNPTGTWKLRATDNVPTGYQTIGSSENGPQDGQEVFMKRLDGKTVDGGKPAYGIGIWQSEEAFKNCGQRLGFNNAEDKEAVGVDFEGSGLTDGPFSWKTGWTDGWKADSATSPSYDVNYGDGNIAANTSCSALSELNKLRCYAEFYYKDDKDNSRESSECIADVNLNWGASSASDFVIRTNGPVRARTQIVMNLMNYTSPNSVSVNDSREYYRGDYDSGTQTYVNCRMVESNQISMSKIDDKTMQMELIIESRVADGKAACQSANEEEGLARFIFKAEKK